MLGGIVFQMVAITIYMGLAVEFVYRFWYDKPFEGHYDGPASGRNTLDHNIKLALVGSMLSSLMIYVRYACQVYSDP